MKVLFLALAFPPANLPGSTRTWNIARQLARHGCEVTVVTLTPGAWRHRDAPRPDAGETSGGSVRRLDVPPRWAFLSPWELRTSETGVGRLVGGVARRIARYAGIDRNAGWRVEAQKACDALGREDVDVILATGAPFISFDVARRTAERLRRPFVIDYRDPWTSNPHRRARPSARRREATIVQAAAAVTVVSQSWLARLESDYSLGGKGHVVTNGFDEEELAAVSPWHFDHFAVVYAGQFYPPKRSVTPLLAALRKIDERVPGWKLHYLGSQQKHVMDVAAKYGFSGRVVCHGMVSRTESLAAMSGAAVSVVITSVEAQAAEEDLGILPSKLFDIIGLGAPLLVIAPPGGDIEAVTGDRPLTATIAGNDTEAIARFFSCVAESSGRVAAMTQFSWQRRGRLMKDILEKAAGK